jgi:C4-dicarboxylate transporter DctQ subunit
MSATLRRTARLLFAAGSGLAVLATAVLLLLPVPIVYDSLGRKIGHPTTWAFDISLYLMVALVYFGVAHGLETGAHFRVHLIIDRLPPLARAAADYLDVALTFAFGVVLFTAGGLLALTSFTTHLRSTTLLETPLWIPQVLLPIGGIAIVLEAVALACETTARRQAERAS